MESFIEEIKNWIKENRLVHIEVVLKKIGRKTVIGRIIQFNRKDNSLLIYADDQKEIKHIMINEIDHISPAQSNWIIESF